MVLGDHDKVRRKFRRAIHRPRPGRQSHQRSGNAWGAARFLPSAVLGDVLARRRAGGGGRPPRVEVPPRASRSLFSPLVFALLAPFLGRDGRHAALTPAPLFGPPSALL